MTRLPESLTDLDGKPLGSYVLRLRDVQPAGKSGWLGFRLLAASGDKSFQPPLLEAVFSQGGRGVTPWVEVVEYHPRVKLEAGTSAELDLAVGGLDRELFGYLSNLVPPGGHLMLACESAEHEVTYRFLMRRVPPLITPLGHLLFDCGFRSARFFYLAEGGWEGPQKLWAEKALNAETERRWDAATARDLLRFLADPDNALFAADCVRAALGVLKQVNPPDALARLVRSAVEQCNSQAADPVAFFRCVQQLRARFSYEWP